MFKPQRSPWPYFLIDPGHYPKYSKISMRGLAKVSLPRKWGLWKVACDAFPLCCAALDPDNDSWERWGGPAQLDPNESHKVISTFLRCHSQQIPMIPCWTPEMVRYFWHVQALKCIEFQICLNWQCHSTSMHKYGPPVGDAHGCCHLEVGKASLSTTPCQRFSAYRP